MTVGGTQMQALARVTDLRLLGAERDVAAAQKACLQADALVAQAQRAVADFDAGYPQKRAELSASFGTRMYLSEDLDHLRAAVAALQDERAPLADSQAQAEMAREAAECLLRDCLARRAELTACKYKREELAQTLIQRESKSAEIRAEQVCE
ncbi:hypothetical protein AIOL_001331 [Candidatus Rhodobacter oscarellae]|uniref:Uncharacterized protein n=1 Tax=Candidatus Rhodobacter oscarellae TaxID=1675527 RepID=A0A0J9E3I0_9RHOB|nr:YscO family type III secretion system apparatus protein [Candidatus Rhodobacter lobularis]KMW56379.1 hypothetical protein AIOL_001331 [Candidatus Rhodobacter lobularis]